MKAEEAHAKRYLEHLAIGDVEFEPIRNETPDFLVDGHIAVEVRRLNENIQRGAGAKPEGLEHAGIPLEQRMRALLASFGPSRDNSAVVAYRFSRPVDWKTQEPKVRAELEDFQNRSLQQPVHRRFDRSFGISIYPVSMLLPAKFRLHVIVDEDSGGIVVDLVTRNLEVVVPEKERKIAKNRHLYPVWWLILVDSIGLGQDPTEVARLKDAFVLAHSWDKVIVLNPADPTIAVEV